MKKNNLLQLLWRRVTRRRRHERLARQIAAQHGMLDDYRAARRSGLSPIQALEVRRVMGYRLWVMDATQS